MKVNCATPADGELENELFGGEKESSDNVLSRRTGRLELANKGTLFLREIARVPLDLQPRLLRVLKSGVFEPLGSTRRIRVNVRWIASSTHDLAKRELDRFRDDLYEQLKAAPLRGSVSARTPRRYPPAGALFCAEVRSPDEQAHRNPADRNHECSHEIGLAR